MKTSYNFRFISTPIICALFLLGFQNCSSFNGENGEASQIAQAGDSAETWIATATSELNQIIAQNPTGQREIQSAIDQLQLALSHLQSLNLATLTSTLKGEVLQLIQQLTAEINKLNAALNTATNCSFNGQTVANAASITAYQSSSVPYGQSCQSETRTCSSGQLSGSYTFASCSADSLPVGALSDVQWSITIGSNASCPSSDRLSSVWGTWGFTSVGGSGPLVTEAWCLQPASSSGNVIEDIQILAPAYVSPCPAGYNETTETANSCVYPACSYPAVNLPLSNVCVKYGSAATATSFVTDFYFNDSGCKAGDVQTAGTRMTPNTANWMTSTYYCVSRH